MSDLLDTFISSHQKIIGVCQLVSKVRRSGQAQRLYQLLKKQPLEIRLNFPVDLVFCDSPMGTIEDCEFDYFADKPRLKEACQLTEPYIGIRTTNSEESFYHVFPRKYLTFTPEGIEAAEIETLNRLGNLLNIKIEEHAQLILSQQQEQARRSAESKEARELAEYTRLKLKFEGSSNE
jgi:hypothetical protein